MSRGFLFPLEAARVAYDNTASGLAATDVQAALDELTTESVPATRTITAGAGLTGGGDLSANRTIDVAAGDGSITVNANSIQVSLSSATPAAIGTAAAGSAVTVSRADHVHADPQNPFGSADPTAGAGVAAVLGAIYHRDNGQAWLKTGAGDTQWTQLVTATYTGNVGITGTLAMTGNITATTTIAATGVISGSQVVANSAGSAGTPAIAINDGSTSNHGWYCEATGTLSGSAGGVRYARIRATNVEVLNTPFSVAQYDITSTTQTSALSANTDNLALTAVGKLTLTSTGGPFNLTGLTNGVTGRRLWIENGNALGGDNVVLKHDVTSTAANRFFFAAGADVTMVPGEGGWFRYNGVASRWYKA